MAKVSGGIPIFMPSISHLLRAFALPPGNAETGSSLVWALNATLLVALSAAVLWLWNYARGKNVASANARIQRFLISTPILLVLTLGAIFNVGSATYLGYEVPRDLLQDIESAKLLWQGQPAFPLNMTDQIKATMDQEPAPYSLARWSPALARIEKQSYDSLISEPWAQAHPAAMTLLLALFVPWLHVRSIQLLFSFASVAALFGTLWILRKGLGVPQARRLFAAFTLVVLGWFPFWMTLRNGQVGFCLTFLMALAWYFLRKERNVAAGICLGVATALKLFPGLLLVYLLIRRRKAFWPAAVSTAILIVASFGIVGWQNTLGYFRVGHFVQEFYKTYPANLSMLSVFANASPRLEARWHMATILASIFFVGMVSLLAWTVTRKSQDVAGAFTLDLEYAMFMALLPLLSPVSWDHYLVVLALPMMVLISCLRSGSVLAEKPIWTVGFVITSALLAVPQNLSIWFSHLIHFRFPIFFVKLPVLAMFGIFALLWGMRMQLAQERSALRFPSATEPATDGERPVAA
jgi:Glycosyltransferase family 87